MLKRSKEIEALRPPTEEITDKIETSFNEQLKLLLFLPINTAGKIIALTEYRKPSPYNEQTNTEANKSSSIILKLLSFKTDTSNVFFNSFLLK